MRFSFLNYIDKYLYFLLNSAIFYLIQIACGILLGVFTGMPAFPVDLTRFYCSRTQVGEFARQAKEIGVQYIGLCCGNASHYIRLVAEEYGRKPDASRFAPDMSKHYRFGNKEFVQKHHSREQN